MKFMSGFSITKDGLVVAINAQLYEQTKINWAVGDLLVNLQDTYKQPGLSPISRLCKSGELNIPERMAWDCYTVAKTFDESVRSLGLDWFMYRFCCRRTTDPINWINKAASDSWSFTELAAAIREIEQPLSTDVPDGYYDVLTYSPRVGTNLIVYCHISDLKRAPMLEIYQSRKFYDAEEVVKLTAELSLCLETMLDILGISKSADRLIKNQIKNLSFLPELEVVVSGN